MINKLKRRIILLLTSVIFVVGLLIVIAINYNSYNSLKETCNYQVERSILFKDEQMEISTNMVTCIRNGNGYRVFSNSTSLDINHIEELLGKIMKDNQRIGHFDYYYYLNLGNEIRIMNFQYLYHYFYQSLMISIAIFILGTLGFIYIAYLIAKWTVRPVEDAFMKQKLFISDVSHELKTPIAIIKTNTELLQMDENNKQLDYIAYETSRMNDLITKLLQLTRIETNPTFSELKKGNLSRVVEKAAMPFEVLAYEKGFQFACSIEDDIEIPFNEGLIEQLVTILLDNALKHTKENGHIFVYLGKRNHKIVLAIKDEGDTIPKEEQDKIFDRFYRVDSSRNRKENRYGLGLSIAKSVMEVHKGIIEVESENGITEFICRFN